MSGYTDPRDPLKKLGDALRDLGAEDIPASKVEPEDLKGLPTLESEVERMAGDLGVSISFESYEELKGYVRGTKKLTYGELKKAAETKTPVWPRYKEHGENGYRVNEANYVKISDGSAIFDNGSSFGCDTEIEGKRDDEVVADDGCGEGVFEVFEAVRPPKPTGGIDFNALKNKLIENDKEFLRQMLANVPAHVPQEAVDAVKNKLERLEAGDVPDITIQKVTKYSVDDLLNADLDKLSADFQTHARKKLKGRDGPPLGR